MREIDLSHSGGVRMALEDLPAMIETGEVLTLQKKSLLNQLNAMTKALMATLKTKSNETSEAAREREAYASPQYKIHIDGIKAVEDEYATLVARLNRRKNEFDAARSLNKLGGQ